MKTVKRNKKLSKNKNIYIKNNFSKKKKKSRVQWGCKNKYLGGKKTRVLSDKERQEKVNRELKIKSVGIREKRTRIRHIGKNRRQQKTIKKILGESKEKKRDCKLRRGPPRLKLGIRNFSLRRPQHIIDGCHVY